MIYDILAAKLEEEGLAQSGVDLFYEQVPASAGPKVLYFRSPLTGVNFDPHLPGFYKTHFQVIVRHSDPVEGAALSEKVMKTLIVEAEEKHPSTVDRAAVTIKTIYPTKLPIRFPALESNAIEWSLNFHLTCHVGHEWV